MAFASKQSKPVEPEMPAAQPATKSCCRWCGWGGDFGKKILATLVGVLVVYLIFYVGTLMRNNVKKYNFIGQADQQERMITISGYGKANGKNDIAMTTIGFSNVDADVSKAQAANKKVMDAVVADLKKLGVDEKDLESNYSIYPEYNYTPEKGQQLVGYRVNNNVQVKIRDLSKISSILALPGKDGATQVSGLTFTIDDPENLKSAARVKAVADAEKKAQALAARLGVRLVEVVSYYESESQGGYPSPMMYASGMGGAAEKAVSMPSIETGSNDVGMNVSITYKIVSPRGW